MHVSSAMHQCVAVTIGLKKDFAPPRPTFAPSWIHALAHLAETTTIMVAFQVMHLSPAKNSDVRLPRKCDCWTDPHRRTDR